MTNEIEIPSGCMMDSKGRFVPDNMVKDVEKLEDQLVDKIHQYAIELSEQIARFKGNTFDDVNSFMDILAEKYNRTKGGKKGNVTFTSFDGCKKVQVAVSEHMDFGAELQVAKNLIDECIFDWNSGSSDEISALVNHAFNVDKKGQINRESLFALRRVKITDPRWLQAMEAITDSIRITGSKTYVRFYQRSTATDKWQAITIDLAAA